MTLNTILSRDTMYHNVNNKHSSISNDCNIKLYVQYFFYLEIIRYVYLISSGLYEVYRIKFLIIGNSISKHNIM